MPTGNVRSDRWDEITTSHADVLLGIELALIDCWRQIEEIDDHCVHVGLVAAMRGDPPDHPAAHIIFMRLLALGLGRDAIDAETWLDALRVVDQSVRDHSTLRDGDRSYLTFIGGFFGDDGGGNGSDYRVTHERIQRPILGASGSGDVVIGFAWYRPEQWPLLRSLSADRDVLEETYAQWLAHANKTIEKLRCQGIRAEKVDLDVNELSAWCKKRGCSLDAEARTAYASERMSQE